MTPRQPVPTRGNLTGLKIAKAPKRSFVESLGSDGQDAAAGLQAPPAPPQPTMQEPSGPQVPAAAQAASEPQADATRLEAGELAAAATPPQQAPVPQYVAQQVEPHTFPQQVEATAPPGGPQHEMPQPPPPPQAYQQPTQAAPQWSPTPAHAYIPAPTPAEEAAAPSPRKPADGKVKQTIRMDEGDNKRAKRAFNATRAIHGLRNWEDFVAKALMKEVAILEQQHNDGQEFQVTDELPKGRPLSM